MHTLTHDGKTYSSFRAPGDLLAAGVPRPVIDAHLAAARGDRVKAECGRRIYAVASAQAQMNVATAAAVASAKTASSRSAEEAALIAGAAAGIGWVAAMRAAIAPLAADPGADFTDDAAWPDCPPEASDVYSRF